MSTVVCYAPTNTAPDEAKDALYGQLQDVWSSIPDRDIEIVLGDFNAKLYQGSAEEGLGKKEINLAEEMDLRRDLDHYTEETYTESVQYVNRLEGDEDALNIETAKYWSLNSEVKRCGRHNKRLFLENVAEAADRALNSGNGHGPEEQLDVNMGVITVREIEMALKQLKNWKAPGLEGITGEMLKADANGAPQVLLKLFQEIWSTEVVPDEWKQVIIIKLPKKCDLRVWKLERDNINRNSIEGFLSGHTEQDSRILRPKAKRWTDRVQKIKKLQ
ncbi:uncharacterized protein LOC121870091 [Homarus americanus]|uniref:uncharacterized protein LOC121870091 n=1 Tax=Homarus americanus TaxID=6706 RepID=UPI001C444155|nr:uncharacterized protein LOC121870091 [Homarus americanus]